MALELFAATGTLHNGAGRERTGRRSASCSRSDISGRQRSAHYPLAGLRLIIPSSGVVSSSGALASPVLSHAARTRLARKGSTARSRWSALHLISIKNCTL